MSGNGEAEPKKLYCPKCGDGPHYSISSLQAHIKKEHPDG